ncbi:gluconate 2-dehydrogenase subunit 3 family protein [Pontibacter sp. G13]|uniref:gluconate 2-dehydrogenase subunit 3 family protein n=1 Tax=Pontibacter sp. G13 TaxID=3074898 RepID=UPI00288BDA50|nr:gluconate 2-dehydrogenase subunit 3 family protein [Pontibacter sp. G13]WNJ19483.1 gluconate 2-dehydrogenase subunit 3 family protein [Pontibacter sp. G13]
MFELEPDYVYNHCAKSLLRAEFGGFHQYGAIPADGISDHIFESWKFPIIDNLFDPSLPDEGYQVNLVTFIWCDFEDRLEDQQVEVFGSFAALHESFPLDRVEDSRYYAKTFIVPKGEVFFYQFRVNGTITLDPINPQRVTDAGGESWSRFFTDACTIPLTFETWERDLLQRLCQHILPFRTKNAARFLDYYYHTLDYDEQRDASKLDENVGAVNFIDKILAREERHNLVNYKICLEIIDQVLRQRNVAVEPAEQPAAVFAELYDQMMDPNVPIPGWDYDRYKKPRHFIELLRRHTFTGAFCHPKYGGNVGAAGWEYLSSQFLGRDGNTLFNWRNSIEQPLGTNPEYNA